MRRMAISAISVLFLAGCGSQSGFDTDDSFKQECVNNGGVYTEYEQDGDACSYEELDN